ncbi:MAG: UDP-N-acetylmuramoyl-L-alanine--D-glutamate ligase [Oligoflexia bacterium]|nr:UDP-N-acetylmuramoyl-L-alanine--D-glutamate ligase [Oligoflexia bacterium]
MSSRFKGKKVLIMGAQRTGLSLAKFLHEQGAKIIVSDLKSREQLGSQGDAFEEFDVQWELGSNSPKSLTAVDLVVLSPGVNPMDKSFEPAKQKGIPFTGELELASTLITQPIIAVTGTNGKSTATRLAYEFMVASELPSWIGGNYGAPLIEYVGSKPTAAALAVEVSSFQLETVDTFRPQQIILLNLAEDHLDRYRSLGDYFHAKKRVFRNASPETTAILNADDPNVIEMARDPQVLKCKVKYFTRRIGLEEQIKRIGGAVYSNKEIRVYIDGQKEVYSTAKMKMKGRHNVENIMAAIVAVRPYGAKPEAIQNVIDSFPGLEHRLEFVRKKGGVEFYNDSKSTNVHSLMRALEAFDEPVILIAGGKDKGMDFTPLVEPVQKKVKNLILVGEAKERLNRSIGDFSETFIIGTFEESILLAYQKSRSGDVVLLSPGCSSYDLFKNYEERGNYFKELVQKL